MRPANPTKRWRISANYSQTEIKLSNLQPIYTGFLAAETPFWLANKNVKILARNGNLESYINTRDNTPTRNFDLNPATVGDAQLYVQAVFDNVNLQDGQLPLRWNPLLGQMGREIKLWFGGGGQGGK